METIQEYKDGDVYRSDLDISKDEWLGFLKDKAVSDNYKGKLRLGRQTVWQKASVAQCYDYAIWEVRSKQTQSF